MQATWLDKTIAWLAPGAGLRRIRQRAAAEVLLSYEAVRSDRRRGTWNPQGTSGNAENGPAIGKLRDAARDLCRNNAYARRGKREWSKRLVGTGIAPRPATSSPEANARITQLWNRWVLQCSSDQRLNFYGLQRQIAGTGFEAGECLIRLWPRRPEDGLVVPFQVQAVEPDLLDSNKTMALKDGYIIQGVEFDVIGRVRGYWLYGQHPGDVVQTSARGLASAFVPAENVLHYAELDRPGDARAVSRFAAVANLLRDLDEYSDAENVRKKTEACLAAMITQPEGADGPTAGATTTDASGQKVETFKPGMILYGAPGTDVKFFAPTATGDYASHKKTELRQVAAGLDIPYVILADDLSDVNYSSYRGGLLQYRETVEEHRWNVLIPQVLGPIYRRFIDTLVLMGVLPEADYAVEWDVPAFDLLDRGAEAEADRQELAIGSSTWPQVVARRGNDPEAQWGEIAAWKDRLEAAGVTFASNPKQIVVQGGGA